MTKLESGDIAAALRDRVLGVGGESASTRVVPNEQALSFEYGVARKTIRRAVAVLVDEGLVARHVGRGTPIGTSLPVVPPAQAKDLVQIVTNLAGASPLDIMNIRLIINSDAAANASASELLAIVEAQDRASATR